MASDKVERVKEKAKRRVAPPMNNFVYDVFLWVFSIIVDLFFREVHPRSSWKVPRKGPVIFVAAPHANQVGPSRHDDLMTKGSLTGSAVCRSTDTDARSTYGSTSSNRLPHSRKVNAEKVHRCRRFLGGSSTSRQSVG